MNFLSNQDTGVSQSEYLRKLYRRHVQGALVRSWASLIMWLVAIFAFWEGGIQINHFTGISASIAYLVLINPPTLWMLKRSTQIIFFKYISLLINILEVIGYTAIIYFAGGIEATYLIGLYGSLITYVGIVATRSLPFVIAAFCSICFSLMVVFEHFDFLPSQHLILNYDCPWETKIAILSAAIGLLFVTAFIASYTGNLLKRNREKLRQQNAQLVLTNNRLQKEMVERERVEKELQHEREILETKVRERTEDLLKAKDAAEAASQAKSEFLANMSHELRTPLNHIIGFTELVVDKQCGDLNEEQQDYLNDTLQSSRHLLSLINDILDLAKVEAGKMELEVSEIHLPMILESSLVMVKEKSTKHRIQLLADMDGIPEVIRADERKLKQILYNLLTNAVKFTPDGGSVTLSARYLTLSDGRWFTRDGQPVCLPLDGEDRLREEKGLINISVHDTGIGIRGEDLQRIFDPFEQVENSASRRYQGSGLGLPLTKRLVELHGGRVWAQSEGEGRGSEFILILPVSNGNHETISERCFVEKESTVALPFS